jgi:hypothetical protein
MDSLAARRREQTNSDHVIPFGRLARLLDTQTANR